jgi:hypothetical protein
VGKGGQKVQVTEYYMSQHFGVCITVDAIKKIIIKEKKAWSGRVTDRSKELIQKDNLFGGATKEGGATGTIYFLPGRGDQLLYDELANRLKTGSTGADVPGYRGLTSLFFTGRPDANKGVKGFYWTANNPYLPGVWCEVERAPVGLNPAYAMVPRPGSDQFPFETFNPDHGGLSSMAFSPDFTLAYFVGTTGFAVVDLATLTQIASVSVDTFAGRPAVTSDGSFYSGDIDNVHSGLVSSDGTVTFIGGACRGGLWNLNVGVYGTSTGTGENIVYPTGGTSVGTIPVGFHPAWFFDDIDGGNSWAIGGTVSGGSYTTGFGLYDFANDEISLISAATSGSAYGMDNGEGGIFVLQGDTGYVVDKATKTIIAGPTALDSGGGANSFKGVVPGDGSIWIDFTRYSTFDISVLQTVNSSDWTNTGGAGVTFDRTNNALWGQAVFESNITIRLFGGELDANPAHIIYEALINAEWGMGSPTDLIDVTGFEAVGVVLYNEPLGLSVLWTKQQTLQDFIQEILDHIQAVLFVDPQTGLLTLKLIRGDYNVDDLPTISPSTANLTSFSRKLWGDIVNEISVTWTNPDNEQDETVTVHDLASITTQGSVVPDSRNYYGVRYADLAKRLAARDLRSAGAPLATFEAEVDRSLWYLRPASVLLVDWPEYGLSGLVARVTGIDYGKPGDPTIKLNLIEDVFGLDMGDYVTPPTSAWEDTSAQPTAMTEQEALTLPFYFAANGIVSITDATYPEVLAGVLGASSNVDAYGFELWGEVALTDGTTEWQSLATMNIEARAALAADIAAEASSTGVTFDSFTGSVSPSVRGFALIGAGTEADNELALITTYSSTTGVYGLSRGVLDTIPRAWATGTPVWFFETDSMIEDPTVRSAGEVVDYKLLTRTSQGLLPLAAAPTLEYTLTERPWLPLRPANVAIGGVQFNDVGTPANMIGASVVPVTWSNRNRLFEETTVLSWTAATVAPEDGQTTTITVLKTDLTTVLATHTGITGSSFDIPVASFGAEAFGYVRVSSERIDADGTFESLQAHGLYVQVDYVLPVGMATETDTALARGPAIAATPATETDTALARGGSTAKAVGMAAETDAALALLTAATDPLFSSTVLLLSGDGTNLSSTFTDESFAAHGTATTSSSFALVDTSLKKFGTGSIRHSGSSGTLSYSDHADWTLGASPFTIETWGSFDTTWIESTSSLVSHYNTTGNQRGWNFLYDGALATNSLIFVASSNGSTAANIVSGAWTPTADTFYHLVAERNASNVFRLYVNGVMLVKATNSLTIFNSTSTLNIGNVASGGQPMKGNQDELRITLAARYDNDAGFTVLSAPYPRS